MEISCRQSRFLRHVKRRSDNVVKTGNMMQTEQKGKKREMILHNQDKNSDLV